MTTLREWLEAQDADAVISDGGTDWTRDNLLDALDDADLDAEVHVEPYRDGTTGVYRCNDDGTAAPAEPMLRVVIR